MTAIWSAVKRQSQGSLTSAIRSGQHSRNWFTGSAPEYRCCLLYTSDAADEL